MNNEISEDTTLRTRVKRIERERQMNEVASSAQMNQEQT